MASTGHLQFHAIKCRSRSRLSLISITEPSTEALYWVYGMSTGYLDTGDLNPASIDRPAWSSAGVAARNQSDHTGGNGLLFDLRNRFRRSAQHFCYAIKARIPRDESDPRRRAAIFIFSDCDFLNYFAQPLIRPSPHRQNLQIPRFEDPTNVERRGIRRFFEQLAQAEIRTILQNFLAPRDLGSDQRALHQEVPFFLGVPVTGCGSGL